jgi:hypothetical protein
VFFKEDSRLFFPFNLIRKHQDWLIFFGMIVLIISIPLSRFGMSLGQFIILGAWLLSGNLINKFKRFFSNPAALAIASLYILHLIGLLYSDNLQYGLKDIRVKLPLVALPVIFSSIQPISRKKLNILFMLFIGAVTVGSLISFSILLSETAKNFREISPFISHIRFSLNVVLAIFAATYFAITVFREKLFLRIIAFMILIWLVAFLFMIESVIGISALIIVSFVLLIYGIMMQKYFYHKAALLLTLIVVPLIVFMYFHDAVKSYRTPYKNDLTQLEEKTALGNPYLHDTVYYPVENGSYIGLYFSEHELRNAWNSVSEYKYDHTDRRGQYIKHTIIRYLNSKNLKKDASGVKQLTPEDILSIENGIANEVYTRPFSLNSRLYKILWEIQDSKDGGNPGGHSIMQRLEFWKAAKEIIKKNFWFGVGTGDIEDAFRAQYDEMNSPLEAKWRNKAHNQYLEFFATFGLIGFLWFFFAIFYPALKTKKLYHPFFFVFFITMLLSMLAEDTLETQAGVTLFALPFALFLFAVSEKEV